MMPMLKNYRVFGDEMILRDYLAIDRTVLANERTLLAYLRTFIGTFSAGIALVKLFDTQFTDITGYLFIILSPVFVVLGLIRFFRVSKKLKTIDDTKINRNAGS